MMHKPVLLTEVSQGLRVVDDGVYVDATYGRGGHSKDILAKLGPQGRLIAIDKDPQAVQQAKQLFAEEKRFSIDHCSFAEIASVVKKYELMGKVNGILLDLGVSSPQLDEAARGFSFMRDGELDMRMDPSTGQSAAAWLAHAKEEEIAKVLKDYGEERYAKRIANAIVKARQENPIQRTKQLADIVAKANPAWEKNKNPATRSFQAIRIFINNELTELSQCLNACENILDSGGRLLVISFHSLEDRLVKHFIQHLIEGEKIPASVPIMQSQLPQRFKKVGKFIRPLADEVTINPRARSSILRIVEKT